MRRVTLTQYLIEHQRRAAPRPTAGSASSTSSPTRSTSGSAWSSARRTRSSGSRATTSRSDPAVRAWFALYARCSRCGRGARRRRTSAIRSSISSAPRRRDARKRALDDGVARASGDFNNDGLRGRRAVAGARLRPARRAGVPLSRPQGRALRRLGPDRRQRAARSSSRSRASAGRRSSWSARRAAKGTAPGLRGGRVRRLGSRARRAARGLPGRRRAGGRAAGRRALPANGLQAWIRR